MNGSVSTKSQMESQRTNLLSPGSAKTRSEFSPYTTEKLLLTGTGTLRISFVSALKLGRDLSLARPMLGKFPCKFRGEGSLDH
jgi:hypothetical protein